MGMEAAVDPPADAPADQGGAWQQNRYLDQLFRLHQALQAAWLGSGASSRLIFRHWAMEWHPSRLYTPGGSERDQYTESRRKA